MNRYSSAPGAGASGDVAGVPGLVTIAMILFILSGVLWLPILEYLPPSAGPSSPSATVGLLLIVLCIVFAIRARRRANARTATTITSVLLWFVLTPYSWLGFADPNNVYGAEYAVMDIVAVVASCAGVALLFAPRSNAYFRAIRATAAERRRA